MAEDSKFDRQEGKVQYQEVESSNQEEDDDQGFYKQNQDSSKQEKTPETENKMMKKSKVIKKIKKREPTSYFMNILEKNSQDKKRTQFLNAANDSAKKIIDEMKNCYEKDLRLFEGKKKASSKLRYSGVLQKLLRNVYVCLRFLDNGGLEYFESWLNKLPDGTDSSLTLKKKMLSILLTMNVCEQHFERAPQLKKLVHKNKRNSFLKDLCESILNRWNEIMY